jgi:hypothetical protein
MGNTCIRHQGITINIGGYRVKTKKPLAKGGYGLVYLVEGQHK